MSVFVVMPLNFLLYFGTFIFSYRKSGFTIYSFVWLMYSIFAAFSVYLLFVRIILECYVYIIL